MNLITKTFTTLLIAGSLTLTSTACSDYRLEAVSTISTETKTAIRDILYFFPETSNDKFIFSIIGHYSFGKKDEKAVGSNVIVTPLKDIDYRFTFETSKDNYKKIVELQNSYSLDSQNRMWRDLTEIVKTSTLIEKVELEKESEMPHEDLPSVENYRYDEEKYLASIKEQ